MPSRRKQSVATSRLLEAAGETSEVGQLCIGFVHAKTRAELIERVSRNGSQAVVGLSSVDLRNAIEPEAGLMRPPVPWARQARHSIS
jgi:hypothetical protein